MNDIDKIVELFMSDNVNIAVQLCKGQGIELLNIFTYMYDNNYTLHNEYGRWFRELHLGVPGNFDERPRLWYDFDKWTVMNEEDTIYISDKKEAFEKFTEEFIRIRIDE